MGGSCIEVALRSDAWSITTKLCPQDDLLRARLALHKIVANMLGLIAQTMEYEWRPAARQLFTRGWADRSQVEAIIETAETAFYEIRPWFEHEHDVVPKLAGNVLSKVRLSCR